MIDSPFDTTDRDLFPGEGVARFAEARARFRGTVVRDADGAGFDEAYGAMAGYFGPKNEIERRPILQDWLRRPLLTDRIRISYQLLAWHDRATGALAGVRDQFVGVDVERGRCGVLLSHSFVPEPWRRSGVATLVRTAPADLARAEVARHGLDPVATPIVLCAEMEPCAPTDRGSIVRLLSYGRSGYASVPPAVLPYCQPDFRELSSGADAEPIPMPFVVRWLGHEADGVLPTALADALVEIFALLHVRACEPTHVEALAAADRARLAAHGPTIALNPLPTRAEELDRLIPLLRSRALPHYPERFRGAAGDPEEELSALRAAAASMA